MQAACLMKIRHENLKWFAVRSMAGRTGAAIAALQCRGLKVFRPVTRSRVRRRRGNHMVSLWIDRGYFGDWLFVRCPSNMASYIARDVTALCDIARAGEFPAAIPDALMAELMDAADSQGVITTKDETLRERFMKGARVVFCGRSPFAGATASVVRDKGRQKIRVLLDILGGGREIDAPADMLQSIAA